MSVAAARPMPMPSTVARRRVVALGVALIAIAVAAPILIDLVERPISAVRVAGGFQHVTHERLEAAVGEHLLGGFFAVDVEAVRAAAVALPWVRDASVRRVWPGSVHVAITERVPEAVWNGTTVLEADGAGFEPRAETVPAQLPRLAGPPGTERLVLDRRRVLDELLSPLPGGRVAELELSPRGAWRLVLANGVEIVLGRDDDPADLARYVPALTALLGPTGEQVQRVDLRYANGFAVKWREPRPATDGGPSS